MLEVLEELEEFTEREKNFEEKYVKTINQMKSEAEKTELELSKVGIFIIYLLSTLHPQGRTWEIFSLSQSVSLPDSTLIIRDNLYLFYR